MGILDTAAGARNVDTPGTTGVAGSAVQLPSQYLAMNTPDNPGAGLMAYLNNQYKATGNPQFVPPGTHLDDTGTIVEDQPGFLMAHPWLIPTAGIVGGGLGELAAGGFGAGAAGGTGAAAGGTADTGISTTAGVADPSVIGGASVAPAPSSILETAATTAPTGLETQGGTLANQGDIIPGGTAAPAAATGSSGILKTLQNLSPVLSAAARAQANSEQIANAQQLADANFNLKAPNVRLATAVKAALAGGTPSAVSYGAPGSAPLGAKALNFTGGFNTPMPANVKQLASTITQQQLSDQLAPPLAPTSSTTADNLLGLAAAGAGVAGAFGPQQPRVVNPYAQPTANPYSVPSQTPNVAGL